MSGPGASLHVCRLDVNLYIAVHVHDWCIENRSAHEPHSRPEACSLERNATTELISVLGPRIRCTRPAPCGRVRPRASPRLPLHPMMARGTPRLPGTSDHGGRPATKCFWKRPWVFGRSSRAGTKRGTGSALTFRQPPDAGPAGDI